MTYLTIPEYANLKGASRQTIYSAIKNKEIIPVNLYGKLLIPSNRMSKNWNKHQGKKLTRLDAVTKL